MRALDRDQLQHEYLDEYEEDGEELEDDEGRYENDEDEEEYEEDVPKPTQEELEYLEIRQRLKEAARKRLRKEAAAALGNTQAKKQKLPTDNFGSFFGPAQPVIAKRVLEERQSILESQQHLASMKVLSQSGGQRKGHASTTNGAKSSGQLQRPKVVNQLKQKVQKLKDTRDYSFLLSDDTDIPAPVKDPPPRSATPAPRSDARPAQVSLKSKSLTSKPARPPLNGHQGRAALPARPPLNGHQDRAVLPARPPLNGHQDRAVLPARPPLNGHQDRAVLPKNGVTQKSIQSKLSTVNKPVNASADPRKQLGNNAGNSSRGPVGLKPAVHKAAVPMANKRPISLASNHAVPAAKHSTSGVQKAALMKPHASVQKPHPEQRREPQMVERPKMVPKQPASSSKLQMRPPPKSMPSRPMEDNRPKKKSVNRYRDEEDDDDDAIRMIRSMFRYDPRKFRGDDDDVSDMEANFDDIQREERRSAKIAREEDERELMLIEEEERRERMRKEAKRRKLSQR